MSSSAPQKGADPSESKATESPVQPPNDGPTDSPPRPSSTASDRTAQLSADMFEKITAYVINQLTDSTEDYVLLKKLNLAAVDKYDTMTTNARRLVDIAQNTAERKRQLQPSLDDIDKLCSNVDRLGEVVDGLDEYTKRLEAQFNKLYVRRWSLANSQCLLKHCMTINGA